MTSLSRSGQSGPLGKCDRRLDILISEELEQAITAMAALKGVPKSEFARQVLERAMFGEFSMIQKVVTRTG
jgi:predicted DNA binding CopG/RHH family protein